jgi:hypothetical protein
MTTTTTRERDERKGKRDHRLPELLHFSVQQCSSFFFLSFFFLSSSFIRFYPIQVVVLCSSSSSFSFPLIIFL